ncbi:MAG TPA: hypothetical protein VKQ28_00715 [Candidatus Acidoferrum sp.]|nr:hypothetical protein [Candidatus Acidoferrum sp.]
MPSYILTGPVPGSAAAATGLQPSTIESGGTNQVATNLQAVAASQVTPQSSVFTVQPRGDGGDRTLTIEGVGIGAVPTAASVNLLVSYDGGLTWGLYAGATAQALFAAGVATPAIYKNVVAGPLYALSTSGTFTLGGATGINLVVSLS